jgi:CRISPR-associated endoribonuclease Cas6
MPTLIEMRLKAHWTVRPDTRQLHGLACALFEDNSTDHTGQHKPFTVSPLQPIPGGPQGEWRWRAAWLPDTAPPHDAFTADTIRVGHVSCTVVESTQRRVAHAAVASGPPTAEVTVMFTSPTYFSQNGTDTVQPDPRLIVGSWRRRWNSSLPDAHPLAIGDEEWAETHRLLALTKFNLRTEQRDTGHGRDREGFTGTATLRLARDTPSPARKILGALSRFAEYCGTGAQVTHGFGATTLTSPNA